MLKPENIIIGIGKRKGYGFPIKEFAKFSREDLKEFVKENKLHVVGIEPTFYVLTKKHLKKAYRGLK